MCRWITYSGPPIYLDQLLYEPENSLIRQSLHARHSKVQTNGDGSGVGWYGERDVPGIYREVLPAWSDSNLRSLAHQIRSSLFFAHVRASTGTSTSVTNCHPFAHGRWLFMHNGQIGGYERIRRPIENLIPDDIYPHRQGTTDSEAFFLAMFRFGLPSDPVGAFARTVGVVRETMTRAGIGEPLRMTAVLSDGNRVYALRYATDPHPPTLYWSRMGEQLLVVSEPLDHEASHWNEVEQDQILVAQGAWKMSVEPFAAAPQAAEAPAA